jgi:hypothetical protein
LCAAFVAVLRRPTAATMPSQETKSQVLGTLVTARLELALRSA